MILLWIVGLVIYLLVGLRFDTSGFIWYTKILLHVFWLPVVIFLFVLLLLDKPKIM